MPRRVYDEAYASVRFWSETLDPLTVTLALRLPPNHTHRDGEPRLRRVKSGRIVEYAPYRGGMWSMSSKNLVNSPRLSEHLEWLLGQLEPRAEAVRALVANGVEADFWCFSSGSTSQPPSLPRIIRVRAAALGIKIAIDHYA